MDLTNAIPLNGNIIVLDDPKKEKEGVIFLPDGTEQTGIITGTVLAVSCFMIQDGTYMEPEVQPGDRIAYGKYAGTGSLYENGKKTYRIIRHNEMLAKLLREE